MNIAELFVNLGIKGADKTVSALGDVKKGLGDVASSSLETKAAVLAAVYGLERMMAISGQAGTALTNFTAYTGKSAQQLQQWQFAARQAGVANEEFTGTLKGVQGVMANMLMNKGAPEGLAIISKAVGGLDKSRYADTFYVLGKLQEAMQKLSVEQGNIAGKSFGLSEGTIAAMRRNAFNPTAFARAPVYSDKEITSLDKSNIAWSNLGTNIEMAFGHFNAKHGTQLVGEIDKMAMATLKLAEAFTLLAEKSKVFQAIGWAADKAATFIQLLGVATDDLTGSHNKKDNEGFGKDSMLKKIFDWRDDIDKAAFETIKKTITPLEHPSVYFGNKGQASSTTINQNITHHGDAKDTTAVKDSHKAAINHAYRQRSAQRQGP